MRQRLNVIKREGLALLIDWLIWGYIAYGIIYLVNHWYRQIMPVSPYYTVPFPSYAWVLVPLATLELAIFWQSFGHSLGLKTMGLVLLTDGGFRPLFCQRLKRYLVWHLSLIPLGLGYLSYVRRGERVLHNRLSNTQLYHIFELKEKARKQPSWFQTSWGLITVLLIALTIYLGWLMVEVDIGKLIQRAPKTAYLWKWLVTPDFSHFATPDPDLRDSILSAIIETVYMALLATVFGVIFAFPLSFLGARNISQDIIKTGKIGWIIFILTRTFFNIVRSIEPIIWAVIFAIWVRFGPFAGVLALGVHTVAALGKLYSEQIEGIDSGPVEAITATGARWWQVILFGVIPQIIPSYLAFTIYRWDINIRMSTVIGLVGGGGIGRVLFYFKNEIRWQEAGAVIFVIVAVVWTMDYLSGRIREAIT